MPAQSRKQQKFLYHKFGAAWVRRHHFNHLAAGGKRK